jgi:hypothetical protein
MSERIRLLRTFKSTWIPYQWCIELLVPSCLIPLPGVFPHGILYVILDKMNLGSLPNLGCCCKFEQIVQF